MGVYAHLLLAGYGAIAVGDGGGGLGLRMACCGPPGKAGWCYQSRWYTETCPPLLESNGRQSQSL